MKTLKTVAFIIIGLCLSHGVYSQNTFPATGNVGIGTDSPVIDLHLDQGDTPGLRLEQNGDNGWSPQTWDVAGNEANFFIRDVTGGSSLPFRISPGAPSSAIDIAESGYVGIGEASPNAQLDVDGSIRLRDGGIELEGVMRWNNVDLTFEGFDGTEWHNFVSGDNDPENEIQLLDWNANTNVLTLSGGNSVDITDENLWEEVDELEDELEALSELVDSLMVIITDCCDNVNLPLEPDVIENELRQNFPNPSSTETIIGFFISQNTNQAMLYVFDLGGKLVNQQLISQRGDGMVVFPINTFSPGTYMYTLVVDDEVVGSKQMIITE